MGTTKAFFLACLSNGLSIGGTMLFVFAGIGLLKQLTGGTTSASEWVFNFKLLGVFVVGGFVGGIVKTIANAFSK